MRAKVTRLIGPNHLGEEDLMRGVQEGDQLEGEAEEEEVLYQDRMEQDFVVHGDGLEQDIVEPPDGIEEDGVYREEDGVYREEEGVYREEEGEPVQDKILLFTNTIISI